MPYNTAEGGSNGTTVLTSNSGGASGAAFDSVTAPPVDAVLAFDNTHAAHGSLAYKFQIGATSTQLFLQWLASFSTSNVAYAKVSFNSYWTANPAASAYQLHVASAAAAQVCGVRINTSGQLIIVSQAGTTIGTMTSSIPLNAWFRVEVDVALDSTGTNVQVTVARYDNVDAGVAADSVVATGTTAVPFSRFRFGWGGSATTNSGPWWMDDLQVYVPSAANPAGPGQTWRRHFQHRQFPPAAGTTNGGPQNYTQTVTDDAGATDSAAEVAAYVRAQTDDSGSTDTATRVAASAQTATDTAGLTDTESQSAAYARTNTDPAGTTDSLAQAAAFAQAPTDTAGLTDTASQVTASARSQTDDTGLTDSMSQSSSGTGAQSFTDPAGLTDSAAQAVAYSITITDSAGVTDTESGSLGRVLTDAASPTDAVTRVAAFSPSLVDSSGLTDSFTQAGVSSYVYTFTDSAGLTDVFTQPPTTVVPLTVTGSDRPSATVTSSDTGSGVTGTDRSTASVTSSDRSTAAVSGTDRPTATVTSS